MDNTGHQEIKCTVTDCKFNDNVNYCTLNNITVGGEEARVSSKQQTDCMSFECGKE